jgi:hypothetical protein
MPDVEDGESVPSNVEAPAQGLVAETLGAGIATLGLSPGVPRSVEPKGIAELPADPNDCAVVVCPVVGGPDIPDVDAVAPDDPAAVTDPQVVDVVEADTDPPPSNAELDPVVAVPMGAAVEQGMTIGLRPPGLSSVAPSGIPLVGGGASELKVPSGEVAPIPAVALACAKPGLELRSQMATAVTKMDCMASLSR